MSTQLLQQALDALETCDQVDQQWQMFNFEKVQAGIKALRAAIAQPEIDLIDIDDLAYSAQAEALSLGLNNDVFMRYFKTVQQNALKTAPQVSDYVPLSDEAINDMWIDAWNVTENGWVTFEFARAIERAVRGEK